MILHAKANHVFIETDGLQQKKNERNMRLKWEKTNKIAGKKKKQLIFSRQDIY